MSKWLIVLALLVIIYQLGAAMRHFLSPGRDAEKAMVRSLTHRVALSMAVFIGLLVLMWMGIIQPHPLHSLQPQPQPHSVSG